MSRWRRHPTTPDVTGAPPPTAAPTTTEEHDRQRAAIAETGRLVRRLRDLQPENVDQGVVYACGYGLVPATVALAIADLEDARHRHAATPTTPPPPPRSPPSKTPPSASSAPTASPHPSDPRSHAKPSQR